MVIHLISILSSFLTFYLLLIPLLRFLTISLYLKTGFDGEQDQFGISSGSVANSSCFLSSRLTEAGSGGGRSRQRHFYTETQLQLLDAEFSAEMFPSRDRRRRIASQLGVTEKSVLVNSINKLNHFFHSV